MLANLGRFLVGMPDLGPGVQGFISAGAHRIDGRMEADSLAAMSVKEGHFYTNNGLIPVANLAALKAL